MENKRAYPQSYSNRELQDEIDRLGSLNPDKTGFGPSYFLKASLGLIELQGRENKRITRLSLIVALLALIVSILTMRVDYDYHCNYTGSIEAKNQTKYCFLFIQLGAHSFHWERPQVIIKYD